MKAHCWFIEHKEGVVKRCAECSGEGDPLRLAARKGRRRQRGRHVVDISASLAVGAGGDPADRIATVDLARALRSLAPDDRTLLALRFVAGLDSTEIATQLGISGSGVRSRLARLIERLRTELDHV